MPADFDALGMGFLWPAETELTNAYDEKMTIWPSGFLGGFDEANENDRMAFRLYDTQRGLLTETEVAAWVCGGTVAWMDILKTLHNIVGDHKPVNISSLRLQMLNLGVSSLAFDLTLLRLVRGGYAKTEGEGDASTITIVKW